MHPWTLPLFLVAAVARPGRDADPLGMLAPLSMLSPRLRSIVVGRYSAAD